MLRFPRSISHVTHQRLRPMTKQNYTGGHVKLSVSRWRIQEIRQIFVTPVLVRSRKYFQLFCFNSCPFFFFIKELVGYGKKDKRENSNFASFFKQSEESRVTQCLLHNDYSLGFKAIYLTFLNKYIQLKENKYTNKETCKE